MCASEIARAKGFRCRKTDSCRDSGLAQPPEGVNTGGRWLERRRSGGWWAGSTDQTSVYPGPVSPEAPKGKDQTIGGAVASLAGGLLQMPAAERQHNAPLCWAGSARGGNLGTALTDSCLECGWLIAT